jgi:hypothetical protein
MRIFVISVQFWVNSCIFKWNPWHGQNCKILWTIVRRFSTICEFFKREHELYALLHGNHENQVHFDVCSVVTELQHILLSRKQNNADFSLKYWVLSKDLKRKKGIWITWLSIRLGRPVLIMISKKRGSDFPLLGCYYFKKNWWKTVSKKEQSSSESMSNQSEARPQKNCMYRMY